MSADHSSGEPLTPASHPSMLSARPPAHLCECNQWVRRSLIDGADGHHPVCTAEAEAHEKRAAREARSGLAASINRNGLRALAAADQSIDIGAVVRDEAQTDRFDLDAIEREFRSVIGAFAQSDLAERYVPRLVARVRELEADAIDAAKEHAAQGSLADGLIERVRELEQTVADALARPAECACGVVFGAKEPACQQCRMCRACCFNQDTHKRVAR